MPNIFDDDRLYVTPGMLPPEALSYKRTQEALGRKILVKAYEKNPSARCRNCQDLTFVILVPCTSGPHKEPPGGLVVWFDGSEQFGRGWYRIHETERESIRVDGKISRFRFGSMEFPCPVCQKIDEREDVSIPYWDR